MALGSPTATSCHAPEPGPELLDRVGGQVGGGQPGVGVSWRRSVSSWRSTTPSCPDPASSVGSDTNERQLDTRRRRSRIRQPVLGDVLGVVRVDVVALVDLDQVVGGQLGRSRRRAGRRTRRRRRRPGPVDTTGKTLSAASMPLSSSSSTQPVSGSARRPSVEETTPTSISPASSASGMSAELERREAGGQVDAVDPLEAGDAEAVGLAVRRRPEREVGALRGQVRQRGDARGRRTSSSVTTKALVSTAVGGRRAP